MPHQGVGGPVHGHMIGAEGDPAHVPGLEEGQEAGQVPEGDPGPVLALAAVTPGLGHDLVAALVLAPGLRVGQDLGQDLDQSRQLMTKSQGRDHRVKKNQDQRVLWKLKQKKRENVQSLALDHDLSLVLSQDLVLANGQHQEVDLDLRVLSKTVNLYSVYTLGISTVKNKNTIAQFKINKV